MPRAKTRREQKREASRANEAAKQAAKAEWLEELAKPKHERLTLRQVADRHGASKSTLQRLGKGQLTIAQFNATKKRLTTPMEVVLEEFAIKMATRGFPLTNRLVLEKAYRLLEVQGLADTELSQSWLYGFYDRHPRLARYRPTPLERARATALTETTVNDYFDVSEKLQKIHKPPQENIFGMDETGINMGIAPMEKVVGEVGNRVQYQQTNGERENVTVIKCICADGTVLAPFVIFKGKYRREAWMKENPDQAYVVVSAKGYTNNELGLLWMQRFHHQTLDKSNHARFLYVDGHRSHCTVEALDFADDQNIVVISYPPHATHKLQGLDHTIYGGLKVFWGQEKRRVETLMRTTVNKSNFLAIYSRARVRAFTEANILSAFRSTGVYPFDRTVVTEKDFAPAKEHSTGKGNFVLPLPTPARKMVTFFYGPARKPTDEDDSTQTPDRTASASCSDNDSDATHTPSRPRVRFASPPESPLAHRSTTLHSLLRPTSAGFLVSESPIKPTDRLPAPIFGTIPRVEMPNWGVLNTGGPRPKVKPSRAELEKQYEATQLELLRAKKVIERQEEINQAANAQLALRDVHIDELAARLHDKLDKKKVSESQCHMSTKTARDLTGVENRTFLRQEEEGRAQKAAEKEAAQRAKAKLEVLREEAKEWRALEKEERMKGQKKAMEQYRIECALAQATGRAKPAPPGVRKLYPRVDTPDHYRVLKRRYRRVQEVEEEDSESEAEGSVVEGE